MNETCFEAINSNVFHHRTNHFINHDHLGYNMTKPATWLPTQNLPGLLILIADLVKEQ